MTILLRCGRMTDTARIQGSGRSTSGSRWDGSGSFDGEEGGGPERTKCCVASETSHNLSLSVLDPLVVDINVECCSTKNRTTDAYCK